MKDPKARLDADTLTIEGRTLEQIERHGLRTRKSS
jgi:hypothetical protein